MALPDQYNHKISFLYWLIFVESFLGESIPIIGAGGVSCGETAFEKIKSGATLLQLYTSLVYEGPNVAKKINKELSDLVKKSGYEKIEDAIGINCN